MKQEIDNMIIGLGATGLSVARHFASNDVEFAVADNFGDARQIEKLQAIDPNVQMFIGDFASEVLSQSPRIIVSPGIPVKTQAIVDAKKNGSKVIGDIELFAEDMPSKSMLASVTGSNGKSTCVSMLQKIAEHSGINSKLGGNIGTPALDLLADKTTDLFVLELSSYQLETTNSLNCDVACILNISPDHLDRYDDYRSYINAKKKIAQQTKTLVLSADDIEMNSWDTTTNVIWFTMGEPKNTDMFGLREISGVTWLVKGDKLIISSDKMQISGKHNFLNALAALAMGEELGFDFATMSQALSEFVGLKHRTQLVANIDRVKWINDSKATNVGATEAALDGLGTNKNIILLAGGQTKNADLSQLSKAVSEHVKYVLLFGEDATLLKSALDQVVTCLIVDDLKSACDLAKSHAEAGDIVLLSPAAASFDMFAGFEDRGDKFIAIVTNYMNGGVS